MITVAEFIILCVSSTLNLSLSDSEIIFNSNKKKLDLDDSVLELNCLAFPQISYLIWVATLTNTGELVDVVQSR